MAALWLVVFTPGVPGVRSIMSYSLPSGCNVMQIVYVHDKFWTRGDRGGHGDGDPGQGQSGWAAEKINS